MTVAVALDRYPGAAQTETDPIEEAAERRRYVLVSPCRDEANYMRRTLDSVLAQSVPPALWVVVDDGSTDETPSILEEYEARVPYLRVVRRADRGGRSVGPGVIEAFYSGLETVAALKPAYLKIDIGLVRDVHQKKVSQQVVKAILDMGDGLGASVIAEGIQAREEVQALQEIGVKWGQGYFYARPVDPYAERPAYSAT